MTDDEDDVRDHVAVCPVTDDLTKQIIHFADMPWDAREAADAMLALGWSESDGAVKLGGADYVTDQGHFVLSGCGFFMTFAYYYTVGGGLLSDDPFTSFPGWSIRQDAKRGDFDAAVTEVVERFTAQVGRPDHSPILQDSSSMPAPAARHQAVWRRKQNVLVVGSKSECTSYNQFEEAVVHILPLAADAPFPEGKALYRFLHG